MAVWLCMAIALIINAELVWGRAAFQATARPRSLHGQERVEEADGNALATQASNFPRGAEVVSWLSDDNKIIPKLRLPKGSWSSKLIVGYAGSYNLEILKPLIYGVLANADPEAMLVLFCPQGDDLGITEPIHQTGRVFIQEHAMPDGFEPDDLPYPVSLRFYVVKSFLRLIGHEGWTFFVDTRDVFIQKDPFAEFSDGLMHFPRESGAYRLKGPYTWNYKWVLNCYDNDTLEAIGGNYVLNSGTVFGPSQMMLSYFDLLTTEFEKRWHCRREHGSDQAMHNFLVYTQKASEAGIRYEVEDQVQGRFAFMAYTHPALWEFRLGENGSEEMYNRGEGKPYVAIHMWPGDNRVDRGIVRPFIRAFDEDLHGQTDS